MSRARLTALGYARSKPERDPGSLLLGAGLVVLALVAAAGLGVGLRGYAIGRELQATPPVAPPPAPPAEGPAALAGDVTELERRYLETVPAMATKVSEHDAAIKELRAIAAEWQQIRTALVWGFGAIGTVLLAVVGGMGAVLGERWFARKAKRRTAR